MMMGNILMTDCRTLSQSVDEYFVWSDPLGNLVYKPMPNGDMLMDFSSVGYKGSDAPFPCAPVIKTLCPSGGDDTDQIQEAIDEVSAMPLDENGLRGTVKLTPGTFNVGSRSIVIEASGVVLQGSGVSETGTVLNAHDLPATILFKIGTYGQIQGVGRPAIISETVPSGSRILIVDCSDGFQVGDKVQVFWPWTDSWIAMMNMTELWGNRHGTLTTIERVVKNIYDNVLILDVPVPFRIDQQYLGGEHVAGVQLIQLPVEKRISNVGIQDLMAVKDATMPYGSGSFLHSVNVEDAWFSNMVVVDFGGNLTARANISGAQATVWLSGSKITVERLNLIRTIPAKSLGPKPFDIALESPAQQILVRDTHVAGDYQIALLTNNGVQGPNVFYNCRSSGKNHAQPHALFATGLLYDNVQMDIEYGTLDFINRGLTGSGAAQGWAVAYGVAYNCSAYAINVLSPPGAYNWALGCNGQSINKDTRVIGLIDPSITSLYEAQLLAASTIF
ncbi:hypothetical protein O6H91_22G022500 [Diphasiastrum complanatum]|uniref:Uncharacterized protein n=1 Tax=Diphasiastrum complanatum TaxID=34168 RepID=A0ACC2ADT9_DIPCM|nr:hypothetical protein O6H91_22G022500 [Diphasiastrum complanatum]